MSEPGDLAMSSNRLVKLDPPSICCLYVNTFVCETYVNEMNFGEQPLFECVHIPYHGTSTCPPLIIDADFFGRDDRRMFREFDAEASADAELVTQTRAKLFAANIGCLLALPRRCFCRTRWNPSSWCGLRALDNTELSCDCVGI